MYREDGVAVMRWQARQGRQPLRECVGYAVDPDLDPLRKSLGCPDVDGNWHGRPSGERPQRWPGPGLQSFFGCLHTFGRDTGADCVGEADQRCDERGPGGVLVEIPDELDDVRVQLQDVPQRGVSGAGVVDGEFDAAAAKDLERFT